MTIELTGMAPRSCPHCGTTQDCHGPSTGGPDGPPEPGDLGVCGSCERMYVVGEGGSFRAPTAAELAGITPGEWAMVRECIETIRAVRAAAGVDAPPSPDKI